MSEQNLVRSILRELRARGCMVIRINSGAMSGDHKGKRWFMRFNDAPGCSDIIGMLPISMGSRFIAVEAKVGRNKVTPLQQAFLSDVAAHGGVALIVRDNCDDLWQAIQTIVQECGRIK